MDAEEVITDLPYPFRGLDLARAHSSQDALTTPVGTNVRAHEPASMRNKGGARPGLSRFVDNSLGGPIQMLAQVSTTDTAELNLWGSPDSPPSLPTGYTADSSSAGPAGSWGQGDGKDWGADGTPLPGGQGGGSAGGGGRGYPSSRLPPFRYRTGGTGYAPSKNMWPGVTPLVSWDTPAEVSVIDPLNHPEPNVTDSDDSFSMPVVTDPGTGNPVPGTWTFTPAEGTSLTQGNQTITGVFTPDDAKFTPVESTVTLRVEYIVPVDSAKNTGTTPNVIGGPVTAKEGDLVVAVVVLNGLSTPSLLDNRELTWTQAGSTVSSGSERLSLWYAVVPDGAFGAAAESGEVTVTAHAEGATYIGMALASYRGCRETSPLHTTVSATGSSTEADPGSLDINATGDLVVMGFCGASGAVVSAAASGVMTMRQQTFSTDTTAKVALSDDTEASVDPYLGKLTAGSSLAWGAIGASFKKA